VANLSETCDPDNAVQLITKVQVAPNNTNDNTLLLEALPDLKERSGLETLYTDGPYAGPEVDEALQHHQVEQIQTGINGRPLDPGKLYLVDFEIEQNESGVPTSPVPKAERSGQAEQSQTQLSGGLRPVPLPELSVWGTRTLSGSAREKTPRLSSRLSCYAGRGGPTAPQDAAEQTRGQEPPGGHRRHSPRSETSLSYRQVAGARAISHDLPDGWFGSHDQSSPHSPLLGREKEGRKAENGRRKGCESHSTAASSFFLPISEGAFERPEIVYGVSESLPRLLKNCYCSAIKNEFLWIYSV
jgi:hypothetical protein